MDDLDLITQTVGDLDLIMKLGDLDLITKTVDDLHLILKTVDDLDLFKKQWMTLSYFCLKSTIEYITSMLLDSRCISDSKQSNKWNT